MHLQTYPDSTVNLIVEAFLIVICSSYHMKDLLTLLKIFPEPYGTVFGSWQVWTPVEYYPRGIDPISTRGQYIPNESICCYHKDKEKTYFFFMNLNSTYS